MQKCELTINLFKKSILDLPVYVTPYSYTKVNTVGGNQIKEIVINFHLKTYKVMIKVL